MDRMDIAANILQRAYDAYYYDSDSVDLNAVRSELGADDSQFWNVVDEMTQQGLLQPFTNGGSTMMGRRSYVIGGLGILMEKDHTPRPFPQRYSVIGPLLTPAEAAPVTHSDLKSMQEFSRAAAQVEGRAQPILRPAAKRTYNSSPLVMAVLGTLISSLIAVVVWGALFPAPSGPRLYVGLLWFGIWGMDFLLTLPFAWFTAAQWKSAHMHPVHEVLYVALVTLVLAALIALLIFALLSRPYSNVLA